MLVELVGPKPQLWSGYIPLWEVKSVPKVIYIGLCFGQIPRLDYCTVIARGDCTVSPRERSVDASEVHD